MFTKSKKPNKEDYQHLDSPTSPKKKPMISIFIKNEVHQDGQRQEQKQDKKDESQNGCMAWIKSLCK